MSVRVKKLILVHALQPDLIFVFMYITQTMMRTNTVITLHLDVSIHTERKIHEMSYLAGERNFIPSFPCENDLKCFCGTSRWVGSR